LNEISAARRAVLCTNAEHVMKNLADKVAFVTGAASGIGLGIATALAQAGVKVMLADIEKDALDKAVANLKRTNAAVDGVVVDVGVRAALEDAAGETIARFGKVHILVNNAGVGGEGRFERTTRRGWDWVVGINLMGVVHGFQIFTPLMKRHGEGGHIVSTASQAGIIGGAGAQYAATKHAVVAFSEAVRPELALAGIGVSVLCPGFIRTGIMESSRRLQEAHVGPVQDARLDEATQALVEMVKGRIAGGLDPLYVGELVREGIEADELYIFTDDEFEPMFDQRVAGIKAAYARIRDRKKRE
jgi:NAD(P)-dependent dehydrogenase (short-subunit alcohol dehydrogenase family)